MFTDEYNYDLDMQVKAEEAFDKGVQQGIIEAAIGFYENKVPIEIIAKSLKLTVEQVQDIVKAKVPAQA